MDNKWEHDEKAPRGTGNLVLQNNTKILMEDRITNEEVYRCMNTHTSLWLELVYRKLSFL